MTMQPFETPRPCPSSAPSRRRAWRIASLATVASFVLAFACTCEPPPPGVPDGGPGEQCEVDLLYNADTAAEIALGEQQDGVLCPALDADYYRFTVASAGSVVKVHLWMDTHLTPVEPGYMLLDGEGRPTGISARHPNRSAGERVDFEGTHRLDAAGDYIVVVQDVEGFEDRFDITNPYHLVVEVLPDPDPNEPNNTPDAATPVSAGSTITGLIATTGDQDWYALSIEEDARIVDVRARAPEGINVDLVVELVGPDRFTVLGSRALAVDGGERRARLRTGVAGTSGDVFYLRVFDQSGTKAQIDEALGTYELTIDVLADPDPQEAGGRNDTIETATLASTLPATFTGSIASFGDQDFFRVNPPGSTSVDNPRVLIVKLTTSGGVPDTLQPQLLVWGHDPETPTGQLKPCPCTSTQNPNNPVPSEAPQYCMPRNATDLACGEIRYQRVLNDRSSWSFGYPLRNSRPVFVSVNDFGDNEFQENATYTIELSIIDDPDPGERGDDYLIPNLQFPTYDNSAEIARQRNRSRPRARDISVPFLPLCSEVLVDAGTPDDGGEDGGTTTPSVPCLEEAPVPTPGQGNQVGTYVVCDGQEWVVQGSGRLSYQGDRDWFRVDMPPAGYWALDFTYSVDRTTPIELTFFTYGDDRLISAWLDAQQTGGSCQSALDCDPGSVCIDGRCWADRDDNPAFTNHTFPGPGQCSYLHVNDRRPIYIEVTDNGINDFDPDMTYSFSLRVRCGCPAACDGGFGACQGVPPPQ